MSKLYLTLEQVLRLRRQPRQEYNARKQTAGGSVCEFKEDML